ncbi:MAG: nucleotidyltransferase family protein [Acidobacteria bacterium]|nr:nucleotidyltransferase family protein [Acidobacteriota bacterium]
MKALVLAAGRGTRMRAAADDATLAAEQAAAADAGHKAMMPLGGRPFLDHVLHSLADAGINDIGLVFSPAHDDARAYGRALPRSRIRLTLLVQPEPRGTADAVLAGEAWAAGEPFIVLNGDNLYPVDVLARLRETAGPAVPGFRRDALALPLERVGAFALIEADARGCLTRIVEKPGAAAVEAAGPDALVSMNLWRFDARIFEACRDVPLSERGEQELPQAVGLAAARGECVEVIPVRGEVLDLSSRSDIPGVERRLENAAVRL